MSRVRAGWVWLVKPGRLARLGHGRGGRAALLLIGIFLVPVVACWLIWVIGLIPIFEYARWVPIALVSIVGVAGILGLFFAFGFWGTGANSGQDGGDQFGEFRPLVAFGLGWLRWLMQVVLVGGCLYAWIAVYTDFQVWHLTSTPEIDALPARVASMPVGADWKPRHTETGNDGDNPYPNGYYQRDFDVPAGYTYARMKTWMSGPAWANSFGALRRPHCDTYGRSCRAEVAGKPQYSVNAWFIRASYEGDTPEVDLKLTYTSYDPESPDADVSEETRDRAALIPIPPDWSRYVVTAGTSDDGEHYSQGFDVPETFARTGLKAWITGPTWTHPAAGPAFGALKTEPCRTLPVSGDYLCTATVASTQRHDLEESLLVSFMPKDHTVLVTLDRNG